MYLRNRQAKNETFFKLRKKTFIKITEILKKLSIVLDFAPKG